MNQLSKEIKSCKEMIKSLFSYDELDKNSSYLDRYRKSLGTITFNDVYDGYVEHLKNTYKIEYGVYTDRDGCTYNELVEK